MYCPECGKPNPEENMFCQYCSALLIDNSESFETEEPDFSEFTQYREEVPVYQTSQPTQPSQPVQPSQAPVYNQPVGPQYTFEPETSPADKPDVILSVPKIDPNKIIGLIKKYKLIIIPVVAVFVLLIGFFSIGSALTSPERVVKKYFEALTENDFKSMYTYVSAPEGDFVSRDAYIKYMETNFKENPCYNIKNYTVEENLYSKYEDYYEDMYDSFYGDSNRDDNKSSSSDFSKKYIVSYIDDVTGYTGTYYVELVKQSKNKMLFFKNYKVGLGDMVSLNATVTIPSGFSKITVDDIELKNPVSDENGNAVYTIDAIFAGTHILKLESNITEPYESEIYFSSRDTKKTIDNFGAFKIKEDVLKNIENKAMIDFDNIYKSAIAGKSYDALGLKVTSTYEYFPQHYSEILNHVRSEYDGQQLGLKGIQFTGFAMQSDYNGNKCSVSNNNGLTVSFSLKINYNYTATYHRYFEGVVTEQKTNEDYVNFSYTLVDGEWLLNGMNSHKISY